MTATNHATLLCLTSCPGVDPGTDGFPSLYGSPSRGAWMSPARPEQPLGLLPLTNTEVHQGGKKHLYIVSMHTYIYYVCIYIHIIQKYVGWTWHCANADAQMRHEMSLLRARDEKMSWFFVGFFSGNH